MLITKEVKQALSAGINNVASQGIRILTGQQEKLDWKGVAVAAISAPVTSRISSAIKGTSDNPTPFAKSNPFAADLTSGLATGLASNVIDIAVRGGGRIE